MAEAVLVLGDSGSGKTYSLRNLDPKETFVISSDRKGLNFRGWKKKFKTTLDDNDKPILTKSNYVSESKARFIPAYIKGISDNMPQIKTIVVDTISMMQIKSYMGKITEGGWDKYNTFAFEIFKVFEAIGEARDDLIVIVTAHTGTTNEYGNEKVDFYNVGGKFVEEKMKPKIFANVLLLATVIQTGETERDYMFITQSNGKNPCKSPHGMFKDYMIPNDMNYVVNEINKYNNGDE